MKRACLFVLLAGCAGGPSTSPAPAGGADAALARGDLAAAEAALRGASDPEARWTRARLLLMSNRAREAVDILNSLVAKVKSVDEAFMLQRVLLDLAAALARLDDYQGAARVWARLGEPVMTRKCETLARGPAYRIDPSWTDSILELRAVDPYPLVSARVNGREGLFIVDTGGGELVVDRAFAKRAGVTPIGIPGGGAAEEAVVDELALGRLAVRTLPAQIADVTPRASIKPDGAIGLSFLLHFDFTIDARLGKLFLKRPGERMSSGVPAYVAGDRYLLAPGKVDGRHETLVGLHTGLAGVVAAPSEQFLALRELKSIQEIAAGPLVVARPPLRPEAFPLGLDGSFGFPVGVVLGPGAFRGRALRLEPASMRLEIR